MDRLNNESILEYKIRLFKNKEKYDLNSQDIANLINKQTGDNFNESTYRKWFSSWSQGFEYAVNNNITEDKVLKDLEEKKIELQKEKYKLFDQRNAFNKLLREDARLEELRNNIITSAEIISKEKPFINIDLKHKNTNKTGVLQLSDWHYSLVASNFLNEYNTDIFHQRINQLINETINYAKLDNVEEMYVLLQGDFISSSIHNILRVQNQEDLITQIQVTSEVIAEIINIISQSFKTKVAIVIDNHSRVTPDKKDSISEESYIRLMKWYLEERLKDNSNIVFLKNKYGWEISTFKIYDSNIAMLHGHNDSVKSVVQNLTTYTREIYDVIYTAHQHHPFLEEINMTTIIGNGSLCGVEEYSSSLRKTSYPSQTFTVFNKDKGLESIKIIKLN